MNAYECQSPYTTCIYEHNHADWNQSSFTNVGYFSTCRSEVWTINTACSNLMMIRKWFINKLWFDRQWLFMTLPLFKQIDELWQVWKQDGCLGLLAVMGNAELLVKTVEWCESLNINSEFSWIQPKLMLLTIYFIFIFNRPNYSPQCCSWQS